MKYKSVRSTYRRKTRARKELLPVSAILFIASLICVAAAYHLKARWAETEDPSALLLQTSARSTSDSDKSHCEGDDFLARKVSLAVLIPGVIFCFTGLAIVTDDYFVSALEIICENLELSEDVAGATFMAAGSSTPEFFASLMGVFVTKDDVGVGTVVGSAVFNLLVIIGLSAALAGAVLKLDWRPLLRDSTFYIISIILLFVFTMFPKRGRIEWWEGLILVSTYGLYVLFMAYGNKPYMDWTAKVFGITGGDEEGGDVELGSMANADGANSPSSVSRHASAMSAGGRASADGKLRYRDLNPRTRLKVATYAVIATRRLVSSSSDNSDSDGAGASHEQTEEVSEGRTWTKLKIPLPSSVFGWVVFPFSLPWHVLFRLTIVDCSLPHLRKWYLATFALSIVWISGISYVMVEAARIAGCLVGIPSSAMGLTVLAAGTSVPDALASVHVAKQGAGNMAVSNAIGSNVFDILLGLGFPWFLGDLILNEIVIPTEPLARVVIPIIILFAIMVVFLVILIALRWQMRPLLGYLLFALYLVFVAYTLLDVYVFKFST